MNHIQTKIYCHDIRIIFELSTLDTYAQNDRAKRFGRLIMEKARTMRLLANLLYKLRRKINSFAIYLYNPIPEIFLD